MGRDWKAEVAAIAHALGIEYVPCTGPTWPGELPAMLDRIKELTDSHHELIDRQVAADERLKKAQFKSAPKFPTPNFSHFIEPGEVESDSMMMAVQSDIALAVEAARVTVPDGVFRFLHSRLKAMVEMREAQGYPPDDAKEALAWLESLTVEAKAAPGEKRCGTCARKTHHMHPAVLYASGFFTGVIVVAIAWAVLG